MVTKVAHLLSRSVRYLESGSGRPLVLLHAFPLSADQWFGQLQRVPPGWRAVAPDLRGFRGGSVAYEDPGLDGLTIDDYARDVLEFMTHVEADRSVVLGLSMGGYVALALARRAPRRIAGLILADTRPGADSPEGRAGRDALVDVARREGVGAVARQLVPRLVGETTRRDQPELLDVLTGAVQLNTVEAIVAASLAMKDRPDQTGWLPSIAVPTTIVCGEEDTLTPMAESEAMQRAIPGARLVRIPGAGHLSNLEAPRAFNAAIEAALAVVP
ncbi:MAG: alpha/beta fold hydrolase [Vicinamibacterales bacterium]